MFLNRLQYHSISFFNEILELKKYIQWKFIHIWQYLTIFQTTIFQLNILTLKMVLGITYKYSINYDQLKILQLKILLFSIILSTMNIV